MRSAPWLSTGCYQTTAWWIKSKWMRTIWINFLWNTPRIKKFKKNSFWQVPLCRFCWNENVWKIVSSVLLDPSLQVPHFPAQGAEVMMLNPLEGEGNGLVLGGVSPWPFRGSRWPWGSPRVWPAHLAYPRVAQRLEAPVLALPVPLSHYFSPQELLRYFS